MGPWAVLLDEVAARYSTCDFLSISGSAVNSAALL